MSDGDDGRMRERHNEYNDFALCRLASPSFGFTRLRLRLHPPVLQLLRRAHGRQRALSHDANPITQRVGLLHAVGGEQDALAGTGLGGDDVPHLTASVGVQTGVGSNTYHGVRNRYTQAQ